MSDRRKENTRRYAKRQITYFKKFPTMRPLDASDESNADRVTELFFS